VTTEVVIKTHKIKIKQVAQEIFLRHLFYGIAVDISAGGSLVGGGSVGTMISVAGISVGTGDAGGSNVAVGGVGGEV